MNNKRYFYKSIKFDIYQKYSSVSTALWLEVKHCAKYSELANFKNTE